MSARGYLVRVEPLSDEDGGGYLATVPVLPGCMSDGDAPAEAARNVGDAIACWIEGATETGRTVPAPTLTGKYEGLP